MTESTPKCYVHDNRSSVGQMHDELTKLTVEVCAACRLRLRKLQYMVDVTGSKYRGKPVRGMFDRTP